MQKISSYLYPNRINVVADLALFPTRWNIVYQNRVKIYQGVDNRLTIDVKNSDQKRIDISQMDMKMLITDINDHPIVTLDVTATSTLGLATVNVPASELTDISPQYLNFTIFRINEDSTKTVFYADTQFGVKGNMELVGSAVGSAFLNKYITRFLPITDPAVLGLPPYKIMYYSDAVEILRPNFIQSVLAETLNFEFTTQNLEAEITIEFTKDSVVSAGTTWEDIETFTVTPFTVTTEKSYSYPVYNREFTWARVKYSIINKSQGKITKVTVAFDKFNDFFIDGGSPDNELNTIIDAGAQ
jgi:hypothetical protein